MPIYTRENFVPPDQVKLKTLRPFVKGEFLDNQDGSRSTERTMTFNISGNEVVVPSLWMTPDGPADLSRNPEVIIKAVIDYEGRTNKKFPRFKTIEEANKFAKERTMKGAVLLEPLEK